MPIPAVPPQRPDPASPQQAASLGLECAGPMPGHPCFTLVTCPDGPGVCVGTVGVAPAADHAGAPALALMVYAGDLTPSETHRLGRAITDAGPLMWQAQATAAGAPTWLFRWMAAGSGATEAAAALVALHKALDGVVGSPGAAQRLDRVLATMRRNGTCVARGCYVPANGTSIDLELGAPEHDAGARPARQGRRVPGLPWMLMDDDDSEGTPPPDIAACQVGSVDWMLAVAATMGRWDGSDSTVFITRPRGGGWYGVHRDEDGPSMLTRMPVGTFGYVNEGYMCYVTPLKAGKKTFVIYSTAGATDERSAPVLEEICRKAPGTRIVRRKIETRSSGPLFTQRARLAPLTIHEDR